MRRTDLMDTSEWAHRFMVERYRAMTPEERLQIAIGLSDFCLEMHRLAMDRVARRRLEGVGETHPQ